MCELHICSICSVRICCEPVPRVGRYRSYHGLRGGKGERESHCLCGLQSRTGEYDVAVCAAVCAADHAGKYRGTVPLMFNPDDDAAIAQNAG